MLNRNRIFNNCLSWPWLIGIIFLLFIFSLVLLPDGCHDETNMYYSGCHTARFYGVTCTPNVDCWDHWPHDHSPGQNGSYFAFLVFMIFLGSIFCIFIFDDGNEDISQSGNVSRGYTYVKNPIMNKNALRGYYNDKMTQTTIHNKKHVWKKIKPLEEVEAYPLS